MTNWGPLGEDVFNRTYARRKGDRLETWDEMVSRVVEGNLNFVDPQHTEALEASRLAEHISSMKMMKWITEEFNTNQFLQDNFNKVKP